MLGLIVGSTSVIQCFGDSSFSRLAVQLSVGQLGQFPSVRNLRLCLSRLLSKVVELHLSEAEQNDEGAKDRYSHSEHIPAIGRRAFDRAKPEERGRDVNSLICSVGPPGVVQFGSSKAEREANEVEDTGNEPPRCPIFAEPHPERVAPCDLKEGGETETEQGSHRVSPSSRTSISPFERPTNRRDMAPREPSGNRTDLRTANVPPPRSDVKRRCEPTDDRGQRPQHREEAGRDDSKDGCGR